MQLLISSRPQPSVSPLPDVQDERNHRPVTPHPLDGPSLFDTHLHFAQDGQPVSPRYFVCSPANSIGPAPQDQKVRATRSSAVPTCTSTHLSEHLLSTGAQQGQSFLSSNAPPVSHEVQRCRGATAKEVCIARRNCAPTIPQCVRLNDLYDGHIISVVHRSTASVAESGVRTELGLEPRSR